MSRACSTGYSKHSTKRSTKRFHGNEVRSQPFFQPEPVVINSYELCKLAEHFVKAKGMTDHSVAELFYIDDDKGTGYADGFASHYQAELITETTNAMETFDKSHIGTLGSNMFSTYFQPDRVDGC